MKKYILSLLTILIVLSSCQKEDDLLQPIQPTPTTQVNSTVITNTDTTTTLNGDTIIVQAVQEEFLTNDNTVTTTNTTTNTPTSFIGEGKTWKIIESRFEINCSELTNSHVDTSYSYISYPYYIQGFSATISFNDDYYNQGHDMMMTNVYPKNGYGSPTHAYEFGPNFMTMYIDSYTWTPGMISMDLRTLTCTGVWLSWTVYMDIIEYSNGTFRLEITQSGSHAGINWDSQLSMLLEEI